MQLLGKNLLRHLDIQTCLSLAGDRVLLSMQSVDQYIYSVPADPQQSSYHVNVRGGKIWLNVSIHATYTVR